MYNLSIWSGMKNPNFDLKKIFFQFFLTIFDKIFKITPLYTVITFEIYIKIIFFIAYFVASSILYKITI